jgi:hypothetical protein
MFKSFDPRSHVALKPGYIHAMIKQIVQRAADNKTSTRQQKRAFPRKEWALPPRGSCLSSDFFAI